MLYGPKVMFFTHMNWRDACKDVDRAVIFFRIQSIDGFAPNNFTKYFSYSNYNLNEIGSFSNR